jgi:8-oxoguanine deaminase
LLVDGRHVVEDGAIPGFDMAELAHQARAAVRALQRAAAGDPVASGTQIAGT